MKKPPRAPARRAADLEARLREAEETLEAIRTGDVDALVVQGPAGDRVFTLKGADHRFRRLVETMNEGALMLANNQLVVYANAAFAQLVRVPHERLLGSEFHAYVAEPSRMIVDALLGDGVTAKAEVELLALDGTLVPAYLSVTASVDEDLELTCVIATDLSEQKRTQALLANERLTAGIVEQAAEGIVVCDPEGRVVRASHTAQRLTGANPMLRRFEEAFPLQSIDDPRIARTVLERALAGQTTSGREAGLFLADREPIVLLLSAGPVLGSAGEPLGCVISFVDVTDAKRAAEERLRLLDRATAAQREAEAANRAKDEFLAMLGHELRNPLAPILTALEMMKQRAEDGAAREREVIERQVKHVVMLVNDLLDVSRIATGKVELHRRPVRLSEVIAKSVEACSPILEERRHRLVVEVEHGLYVDGDEARLGQVISNLLTNAAKYTNRGGEIEIEASRVGGENVLVVRDNGMGIAPELLPTLFDRFVQGRRTIDRSEGGLGLGLSIVRSLVLLHGGSVSVRSAGIGRGSEFEVRLPAVDASAQSTTTDAIEEVPASAGRKVLIVDDNTDAAEMLAEALAAMGHETRVAFDGPSGLDVAAEFVPDIAFLDIGLPAMDGYELARRMRERIEAPRLRLVALTGYGQESDRRRSAEAGFDQHLVKPINLKAVTSAIKQLTQN